MVDFAKPQVARLDDKAVTKLKVLEEKLGGLCVVAYKQPVVPADLKPKQVKLLRKAEKDLGLCLVAYEVPE